MADKIQTLIVDDSVIYRSQVRSALESIPNVEVAGAVANGVFCLKKVQTKQIDLIILDLEMPEMDGLETLMELKRAGFSGEILMFASPTARSAEATLEALEMGAKDFIAKPNFTEDGKTPTQRILEVLQPIILGLFPFLEKRPKVSATQCSSQPSRIESSLSSVEWDLFSPDILVIGSSTGGPTALEALFKQLRPPFRCPIVITQHMPPVFTASFAARLGRISGIPSVEASDGLYLQPNHIYVAPGDFHLTLRGSRNRVTTNLDQGDRIHSIRPAVDPLFKTAAKIYQKNCLGVVLTGMGSDGAEGAQTIKQSGGAVIIQNKESCAVWGMPAMVHKIGAFDKILNLEDMAQILQSKLNEASKRSSKAS
jgi:two-component system chemotaxis response regulator CheB